MRSWEVGATLFTALGASARHVITLVVRDGLVLAVAGSVIGLLLARMAARWVQPLLFKQSAGDLRVYAVVARVMLGVAVVASLLPARRAARADRCRRCGRSRAASRSSARRQNLTLCTQSRSGV